MHFTAQHERQNIMQIVYGTSSVLEGLFRQMQADTLTIFACALELEKKEHVDVSVKYLPQRSRSIPIPYTLP